MKKIFYLLLAAVLVFPVSVFAAGSCTQTKGAVRNDKSQIQAKTITWVCTGDSSDGSIPNTDTTAENTLWIKGWYLYRVSAQSGFNQTLPDAASVFVWDDGGLDLLGAEGMPSPYTTTLTAYAGLNLIPPMTAKIATLPNIYLPRAGLHANYYPVVTGTLTLDVDDQDTASAYYKIVWEFVR